MEVMTLWSAAIAILVNPGHTAIPTIAPRWETKREVCGLGRNFAVLMISLMHGVDGFVEVVASLAQDAHAPAAPSGACPWPHDRKRSRGCGGGVGGFVTGGASAWKLECGRAVLRRTEFKPSSSAERAGDPLKTGVELQFQRVIRSHIGSMGIR